MLLRCLFEIHKWIEIEAGPFYIKDVKRPFWKRKDLSEYCIKVYDRICVGCGKQNLRATNFKED